MAEENYNYFFLHDMLNPFGSGSYVTRRSVSPRFRFDILFFTTQKTKGGESAGGREKCRKKGKCTSVDATTMPTYSLLGQPATGQWHLVGSPKGPCVAVRLASNSLFSIFTLSPNP